jgi:hypothetical protein
LTHTLQSLKTLQNWRHRIQNEAFHYNEGAVEIARMHAQNVSLYEEYIYWLAHLHTSTFLDATPYNLLKLSLRDVEFILRMRIQILKNRKAVEAEKVKQKQKDALEKLKQSIKL